MVLFAGIFAELGIQGGDIIAPGAAEFPGSLGLNGRVGFYYGKKWWFVGIGGYALSTGEAENEIRFLHASIGIGRNLFGGSFMDQKFKLGFIIGGSLYGVKAIIEGEEAKVGDGIGCFAGLKLGIPFVGLTLFGVPTASVGLTAELLYRGCYVKITPPEEEAFNVWLHIPTLLVGANVAF